MDRDAARARRRNAFDFHCEVGTNKTRRSVMRLKALTALLICSGILCSLSKGPRLSNENTTASCTKLTKSALQQRDAVFVIFQRDAGERLRLAVSHYSVIGFAHIVIVDHLGKPAHPTARLLGDYASKGIHVWRCEAPWRFKAKMWNEVISHYKTFTQFIFPLDVDELILLKDPAGILKWDRIAFFDSLSLLKSNGLPFKVERALLIPPDCPDDTTIDDSDSSSALSLSICRSRSLAKIGVQCNGKSFARGKDFLMTDRGNHILVTHTTRGVVQSCEAENWRTHVNVAHDFIIAHLQQSSFEEWVSHKLRGASDYGYNQLSGNPCKGKVTGVHYCEAFRKFRDVQFSYHDLRQLYEEQLCRAKNRYMLGSALKHICETPKQNSTISC